MNKKILRLALPNIVSNITVPLLGMVDLFLLGHLQSEDYIGAIALGSMIFNFIYWAFAFLRMGTSGFTAQAYGERNIKETVLILSRALMVGIIGSLLLILLQHPIAWLSFSIIKSDANVENLAAQYFHIRIYAAPASICLFALYGWFIGMQNSVSPMIIAIAVNVLNIAFNSFFVFVMDLKSDGVAYGTVIAQYSGLLLGLFLIRRYYGKILKYWTKKAMLSMESFKRFFTVNSDIFIRMLAMIFTFSFFTTQSAAMNKTILAVNTVLMQYLMIFSYLSDGFAYAAEALIGKYTGSRNTVLLKKTIKLVFLWGVSIALLFTVIYAVSGIQLVSLLTDNERVIAVSRPYLWWVILIPVVSFASFIWDGIYIGATASKVMRNSVLMATVLYIIVYFSLGEILGNHALWLAFLIFMFVRGIFQTLLAKKSIIKIHQ